MRALVVDGPGRCEVREVPRPEPCAGEVLVRVAHCGVCGTDLRIVAGTCRVPALPLVIGHEISGTVAAAGTGAARLRRGQPVAVDGIKSCGTCHACRRDSPALCEKASELGIHEPGGLAEYVVAPERNVHALPDTMHTAGGALVEPLASAIRGQDRVDVELGDFVAVVGGGAQGLLHTVLARLRGAAQMIVSARHERRRARAAELGADLVLDPERCDAAEEVIVATDGRGADVVIDASGSAIGCADAFRMVRRGGRILIHGAEDSEERLPATAFDVHSRELTIVGSFGGTGDAWPRAIGLIAGGRLDPLALVDAEWPLERAPDGLRQLARDRDLVKALVRVPGADAH
jgi:2-desacetyl-2-hydroxyethyl bacteriochlorophyllide A dehydrogenase